MDSVENSYEEMAIPKQTFEMRENACYANPLNVNTQSETSTAKNKVEITRKKRTGCGKTVLILVTILLVIYALLCSIAIAFALVEIFKLKSETATLQQALTFQQTESVVKLNNETRQLDMSIDTVYMQLSQTFNALNNETRQLINTLQGNLALQGNLPFYPANSCATLPSSSPSGYYWVRASNGSGVLVYCDMIRSCGNVTGGWMRVAELDMTNHSQQCPASLVFHNVSNIRTCRVSGFGCSSVIIPVNSITYSKVCGRIKAYQVGHPDAFNVGTTIDNYVDGISLTHGNPKEHIWTFAAALDEVGTIPPSNCPCTNVNFNGSATPPPAFVGNDYFCDTGSQGRYDINTFYSDNPLWDGAGCGPLNACCTFNDPPWFNKQLPQPTTDDIEMRVCRDASSNDDSAIEVVEIYVQ